MTTPHRIDCPSAADVSPPDRLRALATWDQHVVLQFPPDAFHPPGDGKQAVIRGLAHALPECRVFDSGQYDGSECVTVTRVLSPDEVRANAAAFLAALRRYRRTATTLALRLAIHLRVTPGRRLPGPS